MRSGHSGGASNGRSISGAGFLTKIHYPDSREHPFSTPFVPTRSVDSGLAAAVIVTLEITDGLSEFRFSAVAHARSTMRPPSAPRGDTPMIRGISEIVRLGDRS